MVNRQMPGVGYYSLLTGKTKLLAPLTRRYLIKFCVSADLNSACGIYKITNEITGWAYIGQTSMGFQKRYWMHRWKLRQGHHDNYRLQQDWNNYSPDSFIFSIVETIDGTDHERMDAAERKYISQLRTNGMCYNVQDGGQPIKLSSFRTPESYARVGELNRQRMLGSVLPESTKKKMSESRKGRWIHKHNDTMTEEQVVSAKKMIMEGIKTGEIARILGVPPRSISNLLASNHFATVYVEGWDEFQATRKRKPHLIPEEKKKQIKAAYAAGATISEMVQQFGYTANTIKKYI